MLILKLYDGETNEKRRVFRLKSKRKKPSFNRSRLNINGKEHDLLEFDKELLNDAEFLRLLQVYKGRIICSDELAKNEKIAPYIFDASFPMKNRTFLKIIETFEKEKVKINDLCICDKKGAAFANWSRAFSYAKNITVLTERIDRAVFAEKALSENGVFVCFSRRPSYDCVIDIDGIYRSGFNYVTANGRKMFFDDSAPQLNESERLLEDFGIDKSIIVCALRYFDEENVYFRKPGILNKSKQHNKKT